jgi:hypothetical protein
MPGHMPALRRFRSLAPDRARHGGCGRQFERVGRRIHVQGEDLDVDLAVIVTLDTNGVWALAVLFFEDVEEPE